jgi:hypothetical protein
MRYTLVFLLTALVPLILGPLAVITDRLVRWRLGRQALAKATNDQIVPILQAALPPWPGGPQPSVRRDTGASGTDRRDGELESALESQT